MFSRLSGDIIKESGKDTHERDTPEYKSSKGQMIFLISNRCKFSGSQFDNRHQSIG